MGNDLCFTIVYDLAVILLLTRDVMMFSALILLCTIMDWQFQYFVLIRSPKQRDTDINITLSPRIEVKVKVPYHKMQDSETALSIDQLPLYNTLEMTATPTRSNGHGLHLPEDSQNDFPDFTSSSA